MQNSKGMHIYSELSLFSGNNCSGTKFVNYYANCSWNNERTMLKWRSVVWLCPCDPKSSRDNIYISKVNMCSKFGKSSSKVISFRVDNTKDEDQQFDLHLWQFDQKINTDYLLSIGTHCIKFGNFKQRSQKKDQHFVLHFWPCDLNINKYHLLSKGLNSTKFGNFPAKGSRDIERTIFFYRSAVWCWPSNRRPENPYGTTNFKGHPM